jgi:hypothetical protein
MCCSLGRWHDLKRKCVSCSTKFYSFWNDYGELLNNFLTSSKRTQPETADTPDIQKTIIKVADW